MSATEKYHQQYVEHVGSKKEAMLSRAEQLQEALDDGNDEAVATLLDANLLDAHSVTGISKLMGKGDVAEIAENLENEYREVIEQRSNARGQLIEDTRNALMQISAVLAV